MSASSSRRVTEESNQLSKTRTFKYDAASNLTERVDRLGRKIVYEYDNLDRNTNGPEMGISPID